MLNMQVYYIEQFFENHVVNWWPTPLKTYGLMKQYLRSSYKPKNLHELKEGIQKFWLTLTPDVCKCYINHLFKVIPKVVKEKGNPSGY